MKNFSVISMFTLLLVALSSVRGGTTSHPSSLSDYITTHGTTTQQGSQGQSGTTTSLQGAGDIVEAINAFHSAALASLGTPNSQTPDIIKALAPLTQIKKILENAFVQAIKINNNKEPYTYLRYDVTKALQSIFETYKDKEFVTLKATTNTLTSAKDSKKSSSTPLPSFQLTDDISTLFNVEQHIITDLKQFITQEVNYIIDTPLETKQQDKAALLIENSAQNSKNSFKKTRYILGIPNKDATTPPDNAIKLTPEMAYGSLAPPPKDATKSSTNASSLNISDLISTDGYNTAEENRARLFINQIMQATPAPPTITIPDSAPGDIYIPIADKKNLTPYTKIAVTAAEYQNMVSTIKRNTTYQEYNVKYRSLVALRSLFFEAIIRPLLRRHKYQDSSKSLLEQEKDMALIGLTQDYYTKMQTKTVAEVNLETLYTLNKILYFLHKLHEDNQQEQLILAAAGMHLQTISQQDINKYIDPIATLLKYKCWDTTELNIDGVDNKTRVKICANPGQKPPPSSDQNPAQYSNLSTTTSN